MYDPLSGTVQPVFIFVQVLWNPFLMLFKPILLAKAVLRDLTLYLFIQVLPIAYRARRSLLTAGIQLTTPFGFRHAPLRVPEH
jgi:hypothetical protein